MSLYSNISQLIFLCRSVIVPVEFLRYSHLILLIKISIYHSEIHFILITLVFLLV